MNQRLKGKVKWFNNEKGYGFIAGEDSNEYFVHYKNIMGDGFKQLFENQDVTFMPAESLKGNGLNAVEVEAL